MGFTASRPAWRPAERDRAAAGRQSSSRPTAGPSRIREKLAADFPSVPEYRRRLAESLHLLVWHLGRLRQVEEAETCGRHSLIAIPRKTLDRVSRRATVSSGVGRPPWDDGRDLCTAEGRHAEAGNRLQSGE